MLPVSSSQIRAFRDKLRFLQNATGAVPSPYNSWLTQRGAKTLALGMHQHNLNALEVARLFPSHRLVEEVMYPGIPDCVILAGCLTRDSTPPRHSARVKSRVEVGNAMACTCVGDLNKIIPLNGNPPSGGEDGDDEEWWRSRNKASSSIHPPSRMRTQTPPRQVVPLVTLESEGREGGSRDHGWTCEVERWYRGCDGFAG